jgi:hypothetical protein
VKKVVLVIVAIFAAIILTSCGSAQPVSSETSATGEAAATVAKPMVDENPTIPRSFNVTETTPQFFQEALKLKEPIFIMFYAEDAISQEVMESAKEIYNDDKYSGVVEFLLLKMNDDDEEITELARSFAVGYIPYTAVLNRDGQIVFEKKGFVDREVLEQALYGATNK